MCKALFYKEWSKTKRMIALALIIYIGAIIYSFISISQMFRVDGATSVWGSVILKDIDIFSSIISWLPTLCGIFLAISQFVPEMIDKRLKLTLHLPLPETKIIQIMLLYGTSVLFLLFLFVFVILNIGVFQYFPIEVVYSVMWKCTPWFLGGFTAYFLTTWVIIEPIWKQRAFNCLISICCLYLYTISAKSGAYSSIIVYLLFFAIISFIFPFYSASRFKEGVQ